MFVTNGREGNTFALLALTDPRADPRHRGMSCFIVEKGHPGFRVVKSIAKLGYKGVDTAELVFEECAVAAANLVGGIEGRGFKHVMGGLEAGRINIAARAVGVAQAAYDDTVAHLASTSADAPPAVADMATKLRAARLLTSWAAAMKDRGERCDLEAGMAKLFASESAQEVAVEALRLHGGAGSLAALNVERYYRDTPLMIIGEGTNEIQRTIIAKSLLERYSERFGALTSREAEREDVRQMVLAVRQLVDKLVVPAAQDLDIAHAHPAGLVAAVSTEGVALLVVGPGMPGFSADRPAATLGLRGLESCRLRFEGCRVPLQNRLGGEAGRADEQRATILKVARLGVAATGVGLAQAAFEAALRYSQQRTTFGQPIGHHQAIQLALAGMATKITAARLLAYDAAAADADDARLLVAKISASETAYEVALDSMRVHGGYRYTSQVPGQRLFRRPARLASTPTTNAADRAEVARRLTVRGPVDDGSGLAR